MPESLFRLGDLLLLPELLMWLNRLFKPGTRPLDSREIALGRMVFGDSIRYEKVRLDERSRIGCRRYGFAYVGFYCINSWGKMSDPVLVHELMHVWQYQRVGSVYIPRALRAQRSREGYNYGGPEALREKKKLADFNYEQQADIVADYFCLQQGWSPRWCAPDRALLPLFEPFIREIKNVV
jgi:hypothetical protein